MLRITVLSGARNGARLELAKPIVRLGRAPDNDIAFDPNVDLDASAHHAEIRAEGGQWALVDLQSRNGVYLPMQGMRRVQHHVLAHGDQIQLGPQGPRMQVEVLGPPAAHQQYGAPPQQQYGAPPEQQYGAPPHQQYGAPPQQQYGAPPQQQYGAPPQQQYGAPPQQQYGAPQALGTQIAPQQQQPYGAPPQAVYTQQSGQPMHNAAAPAAPAHGAPPPAPPVGGLPAPPPPPAKMGQQTLLANVAQLMNQKRGKSTMEIKALVDSNVQKATGKMRVIIGVLIALVALSAVAIVVVALKQPDPEALRRELENLPMNDPKRKELEKKLGSLQGTDANVGRKIYEGNKNALLMLVAHKGKSYDKGGFCTAFAIKPRVLASNAHCVRAAEDFEDKGADIWVHLNESNKGGDPKMLKVLRHKGHPKYKHSGMNITPDVGLFVLEDEDAPATVNLAPKADLKKLGTGDSLYVIGFPGRTMDEGSPVAVFMYSHVGRITDALGQKADSFEDSWLVQHEGQTTPGTSGSPIFNSEGKVVAINAGGLLEANKQSVYKYAMRIDLLEDVKVEEGGKSKKKKKKPAEDEDDGDED